MAAKELPQFIDAERFSTVFTTNELLNKHELPCRILEVSKGSIIFHAEEVCLYTYHVAQGLVKIYVTSRDGVSKTLFYHAKETQFGFQGFERESMTHSTAEAVTDCTIIQIAFDDLIAFCDSHTNYYLGYIEYLFEIMQSQMQEITSLSFESGMKRLGELLCSLALSGKPSIPYTVEELASIIGAHRNTVTNALSIFRSKEFVDRHRRPIVVKDPVGLRLFLDEIS